MAEWPGEARGALCLSFDNLGEAAEIELGAPAPDDPAADGHFTVTRVLPALLDALGESEVTATFFVEGLNAELYPEALQSISSGGHEVAYHAWRHEQWGDLDAVEQAANLARGIDALDALGLTPSGMRPPGGLLGAGGIEVLGRAGLRYCSPIGEGAGVEGGLAVLPFQWRHVDAACVLPQFEAVRERMTGSPAPLGPDAFLAHLDTEIERVAHDAGFATIVLHPFMFDWLGPSRLDALLGRLGEAARSGGLWMPSLDAAARHVLSNSGSQQYT